MNVFANIRLASVDKDTVCKEYVFDIKDCSLAEKEDPDSHIMRLQIGDKKFFAHRNRNLVANFDLIIAIFTEEVHKIV